MDENRRHCAHCGSEIEQGQAFCTNCGQQVEPGVEQRATLDGKQKAEQKIEEEPTAAPTLTDWEQTTVMPMCPSPTESNQTASAPVPVPASAPTAFAPAGVSQVSPARSTSRLPLLIGIGVIVACVAIYAACTAWQYADYRQLTQQTMSRQAELQGALERASKTLNDVDQDTVADNTAVDVLRASVRSVKTVGVSPRPVAHPLLIWELVPANRDMRTYLGSSRSAVTDLHAGTTKLREAEEAGERSTAQQNLQTEIDDAKQALDSAKTAGVPDATISPLSATVERADAMSGAAHTATVEAYRGMTSRLKDATDTLNGAVTRFDRHHCSSFAGIFDLFQGDAELTLGGDCSVTLGSHDPSSPKDSHEYEAGSFRQNANGSSTWQADGNTYTYSPKGVHDSALDSFMNDVSQSDDNAAGSLDDLTNSHAKLDEQDASGSSMLFLGR